MVELQNIQSIIAGLLRAHPTFSGIEVVEDDALKDSVMEAAIKSKGVCLAVSPVLSMQRSDQKGNKVVFMAKSVVRLRINFKVNNEQPSPLGYPQALEAIMEAILSHAPSRGDDYFQFPAEGDFVTPTDDDPGLISWNILVLKRASAKGLEL